MSKAKESKSSFFLYHGKDLSFVVSKKKPKVSPISSKPVMAKSELEAAPTLGAVLGVLRLTCSISLIYGGSAVTERSLFKVRYMPSFYASMLGEGINDCPPEDRTISALAVMSLNGRRVMVNHTTGTIFNESGLHVAGSTLRVDRAIPEEMNRFSTSVGAEIEKGEMENEGA